jgi:hypothetical protein
VKHHTVIVELEVDVWARRAKDVNQILRESQFRVDRPSAKTAGGLHVLRVLRSSQYHLDDAPRKR